MRTPRGSHQDDTYEDDALYETRLPTSTRRYHTTSEQPIMRRPRYDLEVRRDYAIPRRASLQQPPRRAYAPEPETTTSTQHSMHWLFYVGVAMLVMLFGWMLVTILLNWWQVTQDDWHYGRPRTSQTDARVGHNDNSTPSHFIALNLHGHIEVIEFPGGDGTHAKIYLGPALNGPGAELAVVTISFKDVTGDGKPDMLVHMDGQTYVFVNDIVEGVAQFRPARPGETTTP